MTDHIANCDCCGKRRELSFSVSCGIDTWACEECRDPPRWRPSARPTDAEARELMHEKNQDDARSRDPEDVV